jgi:hypothetical protein
MIDIEMAKIHLRVDITDDDERIQFKIEQASSIVLDYLKLQEAPSPVPPFVQAATLLVLEALFDGASDPLSDTVTRLLHRYRDPALA